MAVLFKIGNTDLTPKEDKTKHSVNQESVYTEWTDGNWINHRVFVRTRISGSVSLSFPNGRGFSDFLTLLQTERDTNGYYPVSVYCSNTGQLETIDAYLDCPGQDAWDVTAPLQWTGITVNIVER